MVSKNAACLRALHIYYVLGLRVLTTYYVLALRVLTC